MIHVFVLFCKRLAYGLVLKGLVQAKIIKKSLILFWRINMTI